MSNKNCYFCMQLMGRVCSLNITQLLLLGSTSKRPEFKDVFVNAKAKFPIRMGLFVMDFKLHCVGGYNIVLNEDVPHFEMDGRTFRPDPEISCPNTEVFTFDPSSKTLYRDNNFPNLLGPKSSPIVVTLGYKNRVYVLSTDPAFLFSDNLPEPLFEYFDFDSRIWKALPSPLHKCRRPIVSYYAIGHKLYLKTNQFSFIFDALKEKWDSSDDVPFNVPNLLCSLEYNGFLIAMPDGKERLVAYNLDSFGHSNSYQLLAQLQDVFKAPFYEPMECFLTRLDDHGRMCLLYSGTPNYSNRLCARVAVFQVFVSNSTDNPVVTAVLEAVEDYDIEDLMLRDYTIYSTFIMYDDLNKDDTMADASFTNLTLSR
ncbi:uncharacterized protein [Pyrus communis]|uniref:uncharacterized protein n=1 Tax=Pyrus communis TaxID=23211 RepID=UPI0035BF21C5